jgi:hypothetical protein
LLSNADTDRETLVKGFTTIQEAATKLNDDLVKVKAQRKEVGSELDAAKGFKKEVLSTLGLDDTATLDDIKATYNSDKDLEKHTAKYESQLKELQGILAEKETSLNDITSKYQDYEFTSLIEKNGLMNDVRKGYHKDNILKQLKENLIVKDGELYKKNGDDIAKSITNGEPIKASNFVEELKGNEYWMEAFEPQGKAKGMNTPATQPSGYKGKEIKTSDYKDTGAFMNDAFKNINN